MARGPVNAPRLWEVARSVSAHMLLEGVPHALVGGLAVGAHGWDRATSDVDILVPQSVLTKMTSRPQIVRITELVDGARVDIIATDEALLVEAIRDAKGTPPVIPIAGLVYVKLMTHRRRDQTDVVELVKHGSVNVREVRRYLGARNDPDLVEQFNDLVAASETDPD